MEQVHWNISCNVAQFAQIEDDGCTDETVAATSTASAGSEEQSLPDEVTASFGITVGIFGTVANAASLAVLWQARRKSGGNVVTFIINQSAMDLFTCASAIGSYVAMIAHGFQYAGRNQVVDGIICVVLESGAFASTGLSAGKFGLIVITLERYFKIVHAVAHRKYYRSWMTSVGVVLPWVGAVSLILLPSIGTSRIVDGRCHRMHVWPNEDMAKAFPIVRFLLNYPVPIAIFAYCYCRIFYVIRRQTKVFAGQTVRRQDVAMATASRCQEDSGQSQQQATGAATTGAKLSHTEINVLQTMIAVIVCFIVFWSFVEMANFLHLMRIVPVQRNMFYLFVAIGFVNPSINPLIYASRYEVFRRTLKEILKTTGNASSTVETATGHTHSTSVRR